MDELNVIIYGVEISSICLDSFFRLDRVYVCEPAKKAYQIQCMAHVARSNKSLGPFFFGCALEVVNCCSILIDYKTNYNLYLSRARVSIFATG